jgi:uncharacterized protein (DUF433 family)
LKIERMEIDWTQSPDVEVVPGKGSGRPLLRETRIPGDRLVSFLIDHDLS